MVSRFCAYECVFVVGRNLRVQRARKQIYSVRCITLTRVRACVCVSTIWSCKKFGKTLGTRKKTRLAATLCHADTCTYTKTPPSRGESILFYPCRRHLFRSRERRKPYWFWRPSRRVIIGFKRCIRNTCSGSSSSSNSNSSGARSFSTRVFVSDRNEFLKQFRIYAPRRGRRD